MYVSGSIVIGNYSSGCMTSKGNIAVVGGLWQYSECWEYGICGVVSVVSVGIMVAVILVSMLAW